MVGMIDVATEISTVLSRMQAGPERLFVRFTTAVQPGLTACADADAFRQALGDLVADAVRRAPAGQVLLAAGNQGGRVQVTVTDDGPASSSQTTESALRGASQLISLQGGTLEVESRPGEGTITTLRLAVPPDIAPSEAALANVVGPVHAPSIGLPASA